MVLFYFHPFFLKVNFIHECSRSTLLALDSLPYLKIGGDLHDLRNDVYIMSHGGESEQNTRTSSYD